MKFKISSFILMLAASNVCMGDIIYDSICQEIQIIGKPSVDIYGTDEYHHDLVDGRNAIVSFNATISGNLSGKGVYSICNMHCGVYGKRLGTRGCDVSAKNLIYYAKNIRTYKKEGEIFNEFFVETRTPTIPLGSRHCRAEISFYSHSNRTPDTVHSGNCEIKGTYHSDEIPVSTESEYLTKRMVEISREQTNISKRQAEIMDRQTNISQQQEQAMKTSNYMIIVAAFIGVLGAIIGAKIGADRTIKGSFKLHGELSKKERMKNVAESVCLPLREIVKENILKEHLDTPTEGNWEGIMKYNPYFEFLPTKIQEKLKDYFDQLKKQKERFNGLSNDIGRLFHKIVTQDVEEGISTDEYPDLPGGCGNVEDYKEKIARVLLDNKQITNDSIRDILRASPKGERVLKAISKDEPSGDVEKCAKTIYDTLVDIHKKLPLELWDKLEEYRKQDKELHKKSKQVEIELTKFINEHM